MGNVSAKNEIDSAISSSITLLNETVQTCENRLSQNQQINISGCTHVDLRNINFYAMGTLDTTCVQTGTSSNDLKQEIDTKMTQLANSINQALSLNPGSTTAENITRLTQDLSTAVQNSYTQQCLPAIYSQQSIDVTCPSQGGSVTIDTVNFNQVYESVSSCSQSTNSVTAISNQIKTIIDQKATAEVAPIFSLGAILIILLIVGAIMFYGFGSSILTIIIIVLILGTILTIVYFVAAFINKWWPFQVEETVPLIPLTQPPTTLIPLTFA